MRFIFTISAATFLTSALCAQDKYFTRDGFIRFYSSTPVENIEAKNKKSTAVLDESTGKVEFAVLIKSFEFEKALMQEHFNENYMESDKFPKSTFKGSIEGFDPKSYVEESKAVAKGTMDIHGVQRQVVIPGTIHRKGETYILKAKFMLKPEDYNIAIPGAVKDNIAKEIEVTVDCTLAPMKK